MASLDASENAGQGSVNIASAQPNQGNGTGDVDSVTAQPQTGVVNNTDPANPVINTASATPQPVGAATAGNSNTLALGNHSHPVIEVANAAALAALSAATMNAGTQAYVLTLKSVFVLTNSTQAAAALVRIAASGKANHLWIRESISPGWWNQTTWVINPATGSDENAGTALAPLATFAEYRRRHWARWLPGTETGGVGITITGGDLPDTDYVSAFWTVGLRSGSQVLTVTGTVTAGTTGVVAGAIPVNRATGQRNTITVAGIGAAGNVGRLVRLQGTPTTTAVILRSLGANTVELSEQSVNGALGAGFVNGNTVEVVNETKIPGAHIYGGPDQVSFTDVTINPTTGFGTTRHSQINSIFLFTRVRFAGVAGGGNITCANNTFIGCSFMTQAWNVFGRVSNMNLCGQVNQAGAGLSIIAPPNAENTITSHDSEASTFTVGERAYLHLSGSGSANVGFSNLAAGQKGFDLFEGAHLSCGSMWGAGNNATSIAISIAAGAMLSSAVAATYTIAGGVGVRIQRGATTSDIPVAQLPHVIGPGQQPGASAKFSGSLDTDAVLPTVSYLADGGTQIAAAFGNLGPQRYASSERLALGLRVTHLSGPLPVAYTATLYISGVATLMQVTVNAGSANGTKLADFAHPRLIPADGDYDVRLDGAAGTGVAVAIEASASLEFAT